MLANLFFLMILFVILFILLEVRSIIERKAYKELLITSLLMVLALSYGVDYALDWQLLPNPNILITILKPVSQTVDKFFQVTG